MSNAISNFTGIRPTAIKIIFRVAAFVFGCILFGIICALLFDISPSPAETAIKTFWYVMHGLYIIMMFGSFFLAPSIFIINGVVQWDLYQRYAKNEEERKAKEEERRCYEERRQRDLKRDEEWCRKRWGQEESMT